MIFKDYSTLSEAINDLQKQGYIEDFNLKNSCIECKIGRQIYPNDFTIEKKYLFDDGDSSVNQVELFVIVAEKYDMKGLLVNAYGIYSDTIAEDLLKKLISVKS